MRIKLVGTASGREQLLELSPHEMTDNLLEWLRKKGITIASSCDGEGVCKKCRIQNDWLTCQVTMDEFLQRQPDGLIVVSYL